MAAGVDLALHCKGDLAEMQAVAAAAGEMTAAALARAKAALDQRPVAGLALDEALAGLAHG
jgi:beta-N-acetylhexosaminidase